jgi:PAS domain S-box-containing protein
MARIPFPSRISTRIGIIIVLMAGGFAVVMGIVLTRSLDEVLAEQEVRNLENTAIAQQQSLAGILGDAAQSLRFVAGLRSTRRIAGATGAAGTATRGDLPLAGGPGAAEDPLWQLLRAKPDYLGARLVAEVPGGLALMGVERTTAGLTSIPWQRVEGGKWPPGWASFASDRSDAVFFSWRSTPTAPAQAPHPRAVLTGWIALPGDPRHAKALAIDLDLDAGLARLSAALPPEWTYVVADEQGKIVFRARHPLAAGESLLLSQLDPRLGGLADPTGRGVMQAFPADRGTGGSFFTVQRVPLEGGARPRALTLLLGVAARSSDPALQAARLQVLLLSLAFLFVLAFVTVLAARYFLLPLRQIVSAIRRFAAADPVPPPLPTEAQDELGVVARAFQGMMHEVLSKTQELRESEMRYRLILGAAGDGIFGFDADLRLTFINPAASAMLGYPPGALLGASLHRVHPARNGGAESQCPLCAKARAGSVAQGIQLFRHSDGRGINVEFVSTPLQDGARLAGGVLVFKDVTEREQLQRMKEEFVSTVSHELRTPMTSVLGSLQLVLGGAAGEVPPELRELLDIALDNGERLVRIINDILDVDKLESGKMELELAQVSLAGVVTRSLEAMQPLAEQSGVRLEADSPLPDCWVRADRERLLQVATNLISNAVKFSPRGATVRLSLKRDGQAARVSIADQGPGVPAEFRDRIFQKFAQADASDRRTRGGTGLGLSICKAIVEQHGGRIGFDSTPGHGARFYFDLPLAHEPSSGTAAHPDVTALGA